MHYKYLQLQKSDCSFLERLFKVKEYQPIFFENNTKESDWLRRFKQIKDFKIIYNRNEPIGVINIIKENNCISLSLLALLSTERNKHHGTRIIEDVIHGYPDKRIIVDVMKSNQKAIHFYESLGFIKIKEKIEVYEKEGDIPYNIYELVIIKDYNDFLYQDLLSIQVDPLSKEFVSSPENILYKHLQHKENTRLKLFYLDEKVVGCILLRQNTEYNSFFIWQFLIDEIYQNKNIGYLIAKQIIKKLKQEYSTYSILTTVLNNNKRSHHFFLKLGFTVHSIETKEPETNYIL